MLVKICFSVMQILCKECRVVSRGRMLRFPWFRARPAPFHALHVVRIILSELPARFVTCIYVWFP